MATTAPSTRASTGPSTPYRIANPQRPTSAHYSESRLQFVNNDALVGPYGPVARRAVYALHTQRGACRLLVDGGVHRPLSCASAQRPTTRWVSRGGIQMRADSSSKHTSVGVGAARGAAVIAIAFTGALAGAAFADGRRA